MPDHPHKSRNIIRFASLAATILASSVLFAAEKPNPSKPEPILAGIKASGTAEWTRGYDDENGKQRPPSLLIKIDFGGAEALNNGDHGELYVESLLDEAGKSRRWELRSPHDDMPVFAFDGHLCFELAIANRPAIRLIRELRGFVLFRAEKSKDKIRIPFVLRDIKIPKVPDAMDIPARPEDVFIEAEAFSPDNPLVAGLKFSVEASWRQEFDNDIPVSPYLVLKIKMDGKPSGLTSSWGEVDIAPVHDDAGRPIDFTVEYPKEMIFPPHGLMLDRGDPCVKVALMPSRPPKNIPELRGELSLWVGEKGEVVTVKDVLGKPGVRKVVESPVLKAHGISVTTDDLLRSNAGRKNKRSDKMAMTLKWQRDAILACDFLDGRGRSLEHGVGSVSRTSDRSAWVTQTLSPSTPDDLQLQLTIQKNAKKVRVPFVVKDIEIPPIPTH